MYCVYLYRYVKAPIQLGENQNNENQLSHSKVMRKGGETNYHNYLQTHIFSFFSLDATEC